MPEKEQGREPTKEPIHDVEVGDRTRPHWWEASAFTIAPSLLSFDVCVCVCKFLTSCNIVKPMGAFQL